MPNEPLDLDAIEARAKAAPSGPWVSDYSHDRRGYVVYRDGSVVVADGCTWREAAFIAAARTDIPALIARVRELEQEIARLKENAARTRDAFVALNRHCLRLNIPITETAWHHGHRVSEEDSAWGATLLANMCALLGIAVAEAQP